jgi:CheY-like chemotaxis protein
MAQPKRRVVVIDDDEIVLVAISDLLEGAGCEVFTMTSPIGATQVILREAIEAVIIDINLPVMQGDNVIRLFRSWDKLRDLPIVVVSGAVDEKLAAIQRELPGIKVVRKTEMQQRLVPAVLEVLAGAPRPGRPVNPPANTRAPDTKPANLLARRIGAELGETMGLARQVWDEVRKGHFERIAPLTDNIVRLRGQAQLLGLERAALLSQGLCDVFIALKFGGRATPSVDQAVDHAMAALAALKSSPTGDLALPADGLANALKRAVAEMRPR